MSAAGQVAVVTGAGRGLGVALARALAAEGMSVALVGRTPGPLTALADDLARTVPRERLLPVPLDVRDAAAVTQLVRTVEERLGPVDLLVNGAAVIEAAERPFWEADPEQMWAVVETNLRGPMLLARAVLPAMVARDSGRVVNVTSRARAAAQTGTYTAYAVSKRALSVLTATLGAALAGSGVVVVDLLPGLVRTPMTDAMPVWRDVPDSGWDPPSTAASVIVEVARGLHDAAHGGLLDAPELVRARYGTIAP